MKRPIKFRGRNFFTGEFVYAQQIRSTDDGFDFWVNDDWIHCTDCAQLVGFDEVGKEVYEGDIVIDEFGHEVAAKLFDNLEFGRVALKEDSDETTD